MRRQCNLISIVEVLINILSLVDIFGSEKSAGFIKTWMFNLVSCIAIETCVNIEFGFRIQVDIFSEHFYAFDRQLILEHCFNLNPKSGHFLTFVEDKFKFWIQVETMF